MQLRSGREQGSIGKKMRMGAEKISCGALYVCRAHSTSKPVLELIRFHLPRPGIAYVQNGCPIYLKFITGGMCRSYKKNMTKKTTREGMRVR